MNELRVECIRGLRREFGDRFVGGISPDEYAFQNFPDCVIQDPGLVKKREYLKLLPQFNICVTTRGLLNSDGWKLAEYVAGAKAIVAEKMVYQVPGGFRKGKNYLEFSTPEECVENVAQLVNDPEKRDALMWNNWRYYHAYLRPDMLIWNTLRVALGR